MDPLLKNTNKFYLYFLIATRVQGKLANSVGDFVSSTAPTFLHAFLRGRFDSWVTTPGWKKEKISYCTSELKIYFRA
jgi:hypothetical protein